MNDTRDRGRTPTDEERARAMLDQLKSVHALDVARDVVLALVNFSSPKLGLSEETRDVRDLADVRVSIELIRATLEVVDRELGEARARDLHDALAQLQLAYAHAVQLDGAEKAAAAEAGVTAAETAAEPATATPPDESPADAAEPAEETAAAKKPAGPGDNGGPAAARKATAKKQPAPKKKPTAKKKPAPKKKPADDS